MMGGLPWFRQYAEFATNPKIQMLSEVDQRRLVMLQCIRCSNGDVTLQDEDVTFLLRVTHDEWLATKSRLLAKNLIDKNNHPTDWDVKQQRSDSSTERVSRHRAKKKRYSNGGGNGNVTAQNRIEYKGKDSEKSSPTAKSPERWEGYL